MRILLLLILLVSTLKFYAQDYYIVTAENVNVRKSPEKGTIVGKLGVLNSFEG